MCARLPDRETLPKVTANGSSLPLIPGGGDPVCFDDLSGHLHVTLHKGFEPLCDKEQRSGGGGGWRGGGVKKT